MVKQSKNFSNGKRNDSKKAYQPSKKPYKKTRDKVATRSEPMDLQLEEVPDFTRGGGTSLSKKEREKIYEEVDADERVSKKSKGVNPNNVDYELGLLFGGACAGTRPRYANKIAIKNISPGKKLWGVVTQVNQKDIVISLPGGLGGVVLASDFTDLGSEDDENELLGDIFSVGQLVPCTVLLLDDDKKEASKRKILLSLRLSLLHKGFCFDSVQLGMVFTANVKSVEDHGYILHFGLPSIKGFIGKSNDGNQESRIRTGQLIQCVVTKIDRESKIVRLSSDPDLVANCLTKDLHCMSFDLLIAGMMINARVQSVLENGILLDFLTSFDGTVDLFHLQNPLSDKSWKDEYNQNKTVNARILFIDPSSRAVGLMLNPHLVCNKAPPMHVSSGDIVDEAKVVRVDKSGLLLELPSKTASTPAYVSTYDAAGDEVKKLEKKFKEGNRIRVRILGLKQMEGLAIGTLKESSTVHGSRRIITLSCMIKPTSVSEDVSIKLGGIVSGEVLSITTQAVIVRVKSKSSKGFLKGTISAEHLADHLEQAKVVKSFLKPGYELDNLLVLDIKDNNLDLSAKYSLIKLAEELPSDFSQLQPNSVVHGYVSSLTENGCYVRFLGRLTCVAWRNKGIDEPTSDLSESFFVGQSVRANIVDVNQEIRKINLSLKQSSCASVDASFVQEYFRMDEKISDLKSPDLTKSECSWVEKFSIGSLIKGTIHEQNQQGVLVNFDNIKNVFGFLREDHMDGDTLKHGSVVHAVVLDLSRAERLVHLSLKPELISNSTEAVSNSQSTKKRKRVISKELEVNQRVSSVVEIVKEQYLVLSIPENGYTIGYASLSDYNTQKLPVKQFSTGQSVVASVKALKKPLTPGRLLLLLDSVSGTSETSHSKKAKNISSCEVGSVVHAEITEIKPFELRVKFGHSFRGRIHITEVNDVNTSEEPFSKFRVGQSMSAKVVVKPCNTKSKLWELSVKPATLRDSSELNDIKESEQLEFVAGQRVSGYVYKVDKEWVWLAVSCNVTASIFILDTACEANELEEFERRFTIGQAVSGYVLTYNKEKNILLLVQRLLLDIHKSIANGGGSKMDKLDSSISGDDAALYFRKGDILGGKIYKILPGVGGLRVQIGPYVFGRVHFTEINDSWVFNPLDGFREGQFVKSKVLEISSSSKGTLQIELSLRTSLDGMTSGHPSEAFNDKDYVLKRFEKIEDLSPDMGVQGYVKNMTSKGCFILLSRTLEARVLLSNLRDTFVKEPEKEFPVRKLVTGRVLNVEPLSKRVEVTLKFDMKKLHAGDTISGKIQSVMSYGLFISIDQTGMVKKPFEGLLELRVAFADFMSRIMGGNVSFDPSNMVITAGGTPAIEVLAFCLADHGNAFLIPSPYYPGFDRDIKFRTGVELIPVHCRSEHDLSDHVSLVCQAIDRDEDLTKSKTLRGGMCKSEEKKDGKRKREEKKDGKRKREEKKDGKRKREEKEDDRTFIAKDDATFRAKLKAAGLEITNILGDGNCFFRALAHQLGKNEKEHEKCRKRIVNYMKANRAKFEALIRASEVKDFDTYCDNMQKLRSWGGGPELIAAASLFQRDIFVYSREYPEPLYFPASETGSSGTDRILLSFHHDHYNSLHQQKDPDASQKNEAKGASSSLEEENQIEEEDSYDEDDDVAGEKIDEIRGKRPTCIWWDYENAPVPYDFPTEGVVYQRILKSLKERGFTGPLTVKIVVGYKDSYVRPMGKEIEIIPAFDTERPVGSKHNQAADEYMGDLVKKWLEEGHPPQNIVVMTADNDFKAMISDLVNSGHTAILVSIQQENQANSVEISALASFYYDFRRIMRMGKSRLSSQIRRKGRMVEIKDRIIAERKARKLKEKKREKEKKKKEKRKKEKEAK